jgi:hypothetical protein
VPFAPETIALAEGSAEQPYDWSMIADLVWTGEFRGTPGKLTVPATGDEPFRTDLASVPQWLTWLFPRYGKYTKAAVLHDYLCQNFRDVTVERVGSDDIELKDRSDADEVFRIVMAELGVPWARRWLMWSAVNWATLFTSVWPGRRSRPVRRWLGRVLLLVGVVDVVLVVRTGVIGDVGPVALPVVAAGVAAVAMLAGFVALGRWDRWLVCLAGLGMTVASLPLLVAGGMVGLLLVFYLLFEDAFSGFSTLRHYRRRRATVPRAERIAAVQAS